MAPDIANYFHVASRRLSGTALRKEQYRSLNTALGPEKEKRVKLRSLT